MRVITNRGRAKWVAAILSLVLIFGLFAYLPLQEASAKAVTTFVKDNIVYQVESLPNTYGYGSNGSVTIIDHTDAFYHYLEEGGVEDVDVVLPKAVTTTFNGTDSSFDIVGIDQYAFYGAYIGRLDLSECTSLKRIGLYAFAAERIGEISLPEGLEVIEAFAFRPWSYTSQEPITLPSTLKKLDKGSLMGVARSLIFKGMTAPACGSSDGGVINMEAYSPERPLIVRYPHGGTGYHLDMFGYDGNWYKELGVFDVIEDNIVPAAHPNASVGIEKGYTAQVPVSSIASDGDGDNLVITGISVVPNSAIATATHDAGTLSISGVGVGSTTLTATVVDGHGGIVDVPLLIQVSSSQPLASYKLNIATSGLGATGTVSGTVSTNGVSKDLKNSTTAFTIQQSSSIALKAIPKAGYRFDSWTVTGIDVGTTSEDLLFDMPGQNVTVKANFVKITPAKLTILTNGSGSTGTVEGFAELPGGNIALKNSLTAFTIPVPSNIDIAAIPKPGYRFVSWTATGINISPNKLNDDCLRFPWTVQNANVTIKANFEKIQPGSLTISTSDLGATGTVEGVAMHSTGVEKLLKNSTTAFTILSDSTVSLKAVPKLGYRFASWTITGVAADELPDAAGLTDPDLGFRMPAGKVTVKANFAKAATNKLTISTNNLGATGTVKGTAREPGSYISMDLKNSTTAFDVPEGCYLEIDAVPKSGYWLASWTLTGLDPKYYPEEVLPANGHNKLHLTMPGNAVTVKANFEKVPMIKLTILTSGSGSTGTVEGSAYETDVDEAVPIKLYNKTAAFNLEQGMDLSIWLNAIPKDGYRFVSWTVTGLDFKEPLTGDYPFHYTFYRGEYPGVRNVTVKANFEKAEPSYLTISTSDLGATGTVTGFSTAPFGVEKLLKNSTAPFFIPPFSTVRLEAVPKAGYRFSSWTLTGISGYYINPNAPILSFDMPEGNVSAKANFVKITP